MASLKAVTPAEALAVWKSLKNPTARMVAKVLTQAGRRVHHATISRWRAQGWRPVAHGPHPIEGARNALDVAARLLTGDPAIGAEVFAARSKTDEQLGASSDSELVRRSSRDLLKLQILLCQATCESGVLLLHERVSETALLLKALSNANRVASLALCQAGEFPEQPGRGSDIEDEQSDSLAELARIFDPAEPTS